MPKVSSPEDWPIIYTFNHLSNKEKTKKYLQSITLPYVHTKKAKIIEDYYISCSGHICVFNRQTTEAILQILEANHIYFVSIPPNCTSKLQLMDLNVNKTLKGYLEREFSEWYSSIVYQNFTTSYDGNPPPVDFRMSIMKPLQLNSLSKHITIFKLMVRS